MSRVNLCHLVDHRAQHVEQGPTRVANLDRRAEEAANERVVFQPAGGADHHPEVPHFPLRHGGAHHPEEHVGAERAARG